MWERKTFQLRRVAWTSLPAKILSPLPSFSLQPPKAPVFLSRPLCHRPPPIFQKGFPKPDLESSPETSPFGTCGGCSVFLLLGKASSLEELPSPHLSPDREPGAVRFPWISHLEHPTSMHVCSPPSPCDRLPQGGGSVTLGGVGLPKEAEEGEPFVPGGESRQADQLNSVLLCRLYPSPSPAETPEGAP